MKVLPKLANKCFLLIYYTVFWNQSVRYLMEGYLNLTYNSLTLLTNTPLFKNRDTIDQPLFALFILTICLFAPIVVSFYLAFKIDYFR